MGILFNYASDLNLAAYDSAPEFNKAVVLIGGLNNGIHGVAFAERLSDSLEKLEWSLVEASLNSSGTGWGSGSVRRDATEIAQLVEYLATHGKEHIVLIGHSTGSQDLTTLSYLWKNEPESLPWTTTGAGVVRGIGLQAPVSDRDVIEDSIPDVHKTWVVPEGLTEDDAVPANVVSKFIPNLVTYRRWKSLASPPPVKDGKYVVDVDVSEDYFSKDLPDDYRQQLLGSFQVPVAFFISANDESYPKSFSTEDISGLLATFKRNASKASDASAVIPGASHAVPEPEGQAALFPKIAAFLAEVVPV